MDASFSRRRLLAAAPALRTRALAGPVNILYLHSHDTGRYIQPYGHAVPTPNLQKFASEAVIFRQAFDAAPTCSPSRAALLTGMVPHSCGMLGLAHRGFRLNDSSRHLARYLRSQGYLTVLSGIQHETAAGRVAELGYENILKTRTNRGPDVAGAAAEFLLSRPKEPFFLSCGFFETHREFPVPGPQDDPRFVLPPAPLPDTPETRRDMAAFHASARVLDQAMGAVLEALERSGLASNTLVIVTTDHGIAFPRMKCNLNAHGMGVMLMMRGPGGFSGGKVSDALVSQIDLFPTLCEVAGIPRPGWLQGRSLMPLIRGEKSEIREWLTGEVTFHAAYEPQRAIRSRRWSYVRRFGSKRTPVLPNCDDGPSKSVWLEHNWGARQLDQEALYDLVFDPAESRNVLAEHPKEAEHWRRLMEEWMRETNDPLLKGEVPPPPGARVNNPDGVSPREPVIEYD
jgi:arylsulfatase A-like enzyme